MNWIMPAIMWCASCGFEGTVFTPAIPAEQYFEIKERIDAAARQRMLTQRMAASTCLVMTGADDGNRASMARSAFEDFDEVLNALQSGDPFLGLGAETDPDVLVTLEHMQGLWMTLGPAVQQLVGGDLHTVVIDQLIGLNLDALERADRIVDAVIAAHGTDVVHTGISRTLNVAGYQRMLSQKMLKEACLMAAGLETATIEASLAATMDRFSAKLVQLQDGDRAAGILAPPTVQIAERWARIDALWQDYRAALSQVRLNDLSQRESLRDLSWQSDRILNELTGVMILYVAAL